MAGEEDPWKEVLDSVQDAVGRQVKLTLKKKVQLEVKSEKLESRILALAAHRAYLLSARAPARIEQTFNFFDIQSVSSNKSNQLVLEYDKGQLSVKLSSNEEVDEVIAQIGSSIQEHCPGLNPVRVIKKLSLKPAERVTSLQTLWENNTPADTGPCGAFSRMYWCLCDQQGFPYREEVQWDVDTIYLTQDTRELNLQDFIHLENRDLMGIVAVLEYNQWFTRLSLKDYKLSTDLCDQILRVVARSSRLEELVLENTGLKADFAQKLSSALSQNPHSALHTLVLTNNSLEDKGIASLSSSLGKLSSGLKHLNLSKNSLSTKGVNILAQALCSNPSIFNTLTHLDLSGNSLRGDDLPNLWNFLGQPNSLQTLDLSSCDCSLDLVCSSLLRGSLKHLSVLNMSKSVFNLKRGKELPSSFKQFFNNAQALNTIILSGTKLPLEALKALLLGLASNPNLKDISLDLSSCELRSAGSQILEGCIAEIPNISSLDISDNGLDSDLTTLLVWLAKNRSIRNLSLGKNFSNIKSKNLGQVLSSLVLMIQEEESPLSSLSLADSKLKADLSIVLNAVGGNSSLTRLDISGNSMGDMGAKMLAKALQINTKLRTVIWDRNNVSAQGLQDVAAALEKNYTIRFMPMPIMDAALALKSSPEKTEDALMKMEQYLLRNHETRKYLQEQAYRLQQGIVTSTTQQMIDRLCVKVQDHLNSLRFSEREIVQEDMKAAEKLVQDARNSKRLLANMYHLRSLGRGGGVSEGGESPWAGPIQEELQSMVGEISTVIDQQLQSLLVSMVDTAESVCPHVMRKANLRPALMRASEGKMSVPQSFITDTLLKQSAVDIINKISEVKLSLASFLSDRIIDEILASLSRSQQRLAEHLSRRGQPLLHHDSEETEVVDETNLLPENLPAPPDDLLLTPTSKRKSILFRMVRPVSVAFELEFDLDKALEHVPIHLEDLPLPLPPTPVEAELVRQRSVGLSDLPETESPKLQHITKQRPRRKKTAKTSKPPALRRAAPVEEVELESLVGKVDEGVDEFFSKKVTKIGAKRSSVRDSVVEGERKRESRMSGFFNLIKSRTSTKTPPTSPHTPSTAPASVTPTTTTPIVTTANPPITAAASVEESDETDSTKTAVKSPLPDPPAEPISSQPVEKAGPCDHGEVAAAPEPKAQAEEGKKKEGAPAGRIRGVQVMGNDFLAQLRAKQEKLKEKAPESSVPTVKLQTEHGEGGSSTVEKLLHKEPHPEPAFRSHSPLSQPKHAGPPHAPIPAHVPATKLTPATSTQAATKFTLTPHPNSSKPAQNPQPSPPPSLERLPSLEPQPSSQVPSPPMNKTPSLEPLPSPRVPPPPVTSPPSSSSSSSISADDVVSGRPSAGSSPMLPVPAPRVKSAPSDTETKEQSPVYHSSDRIPPHIMLDPAVEDSVFESELNTHTSHTPETGQHSSPRHSSTHPAEKEDHQHSTSLPSPVDLMSPTDFPSAPSLSTTDSDSEHQPDDQHTEIPDEDETSE
ncbi:F-actin-uncapping protein LRRC16A [Astyanax mexicanus]|uniref:F-actin-uncapping protein LRRC16A n=1 Tax=Astyanax mexicanus TaxID=7994 RepID=UPI0020CB1F16|nr:F-actin-uncapping protein LRRC16A [Astyanax mexicanus]